MVAISQQQPMRPRRACKSRMPLSSYIPAFLAFQDNTISHRNFKLEKRCIDIKPGLRLIVMIHASEQDRCLPVKCVADYESIPVKVMNAAC